MHILPFNFSIFLTGFATICQAIAFFYPGRNQMMFYVCCGEMPANLLNEKVKVNRAFTLVLLFTAIVQLSFLLKSVIFKIFKKEHAEEGPTAVIQYLKQRFTRDAIFRYLHVFFCRLGISHEVMARPPTYLGDR